MDIDRFEAGAVDPFDDADQRFRWTFRVDSHSAPVLGNDRPHDLGPFGNIPIEERVRQSYLDGRLASAPLLQFTRAADGNNLAGIDNRHPVAQALGFFYIMSGHQDRPLFGP